LARAVIGDPQPAVAPLCHPPAGLWRLDMAQAVPLLWLLLGASLFGVITRVAIPRNQFHIH
jgi:hypothetical protein